MGGNQVRAHISWDLDSTLCDTRHRQGMIEGFRARGLPVDWVAYSMACALDGPTDSVALCQLMQGWGVSWHVVSGRSEQARVPTMVWLASHGLRPTTVNLCQPEEEELHSLLGHVRWKAERVARLAKEYPVGLHVDDYEGVAELVEELTGGQVRGVTVTPPGWLTINPASIAKAPL